MIVWERLSIESMESSIKNYKHLGEQESNLECVSILTEFNRRKTIRFSRGERVPERDYSKIEDEKVLS